MGQPVEKTQHPARTGLDIALAIATWIGVVAMGFGLFSWLQAVAPLSDVLGRIRQIVG